MGGQLRIWDQRIRLASEEAKVGRKPDPIVAEGEVIKVELKTNLTRKSHGLACLYAFIWMDTGYIVHIDAEALSAILSAYTEDKIK